MKAIQIRDVPDRLHRTLKARAALAGLSLSEYLLQELHRLAARSEAVEVLRRADARPTGISTRQIVAAVRSGRDRR